MDNASVEQIHDKFNNITKKPEKFLSAPGKLVDNIKELLKETYNFVKSGEPTKTINTLPNLIVKNFDVEQIWQQIELQNDDILTKHLRSVGRLVAQKDNLWLVDDEANSDDEHNKNNDAIENNINQDENDMNGRDENDMNGEDENDINDDDENCINDDSNEEDSNTDDIDVKKKKKPIKNSKKSSVDDDFFKMDEMEKFLIREEQNPKSKKKDSDDEDDEESVDLFDMKSGDEYEDDEGDKEEESDTENNPKYDEFFGEGNKTEKTKRKRPTEESSDDDDDNNNDGSDKEDTNLKSSLEMKNERLRKKIEDIEDQALQDKSWQYRGEVTADKRPQNSLLEEIVDFDMTVRPAPVITEETTYKLEDVIKKRIKDKVWDDVERKTKLADTFVEYKKKLILDQEKSKQSLAQIYEDEYLKQKEALNPDAADKPEVEPIEQTEIKIKMKNLFAKLDALSNFHFTPKSVAPEIRIVNNLPAINMEEVVPVASSDAALLAPEEIKKKTKGDVIGKTERTKTDKNRERRQKKLKQQEHAKDIKNKEKTKQNKVGLGAKYNKQKAANLLEKVTKDSNVNKMNESGAATKSSTKFFTQLQDEVRGHINNKTKQMKKQNNKPTHIAKKLKL